MARALGAELESTKLVFQDLATTFDRMQRAKRQGRPVVGTWVASPYEILIAGNIFTTSYRGEQDLFKDIIKGDYAKRRWIDEFGVGTCFCLDVCQSVGDPTPAAFPGYSFVTTSFPDKLPEWKDLIKKIGNYWDIVSLELPRGLSKNEAREHIYEKLEGRAKNSCGISSVYSFEQGGAGPIENKHR